MKQSREIISFNCKIIFTWADKEVPDLKIYDYEGKANIVGPKIKQLRISQKMTQEELAIKMQLENIELSQKVISRIEKQERFVADYELLTFCKVLKVDMKELF